MKLNIRICELTVIYFLVKAETKWFSFPRQSTFGGSTVEDVLQKDPVSPMNSLVVCPVQAMTATPNRLSPAWEQTIRKGSGQQGSKFVPAKACAGSVEC